MKNGNGKEGAASKHFKEAAARFGNYMEKPGEADLFHTLA